MRGAWFAAGLLLLAAPFASAVGPSARPGMGSIPYAEGSGTGTTFRVWAPNASSVGVKGGFSGWGTIALTSEGASGLWSGDVSGAKVGDEYKYVVNGSSDHRDPRARRVTHSAGNSMIYSTNAFDWGGDNFDPPWKNDLVIYELHAGTYNAEDWVPSSFDKDIERLDHLRGLGVSAVEVMPPSEFAADKSWGYNPADPFAIESALGGPDAFKRFVKACHQRGIAVLVDVVHNHYGPSDLSLWQFDGWSQNGKGGIYFYNDARASTMWGETRPDYGRTEVRDFIKDHIRSLLDEYHVDGFRWDSVFSIIYYNSGASTLPDGRSLLAEINQEMDTTHPGAIRIAEDHGFDYSMSFDSQWDVGFHDDIKWQVTQGSDSARNMQWLGNRIAAWPSLQRVIFSESHDGVGNLNGKNRLPKDIDGGNATSLWARKRQLLAAATVLTSPGTPMIFQGQEMNETLSFASETSLRWSLTNTWKGIVDAYADLIHLRRNLRGGTQGLKGTGVNVHHRDDLNKVIASVRWDAGGQVDDVVVVQNFAVTQWTNNGYLIEFPSAGTWYTRFNSDRTNYGSDFGNIGPTQVVASGSPPKAAVNMGMYSTLIFSKTPPPQAGIVTLDPAVPTGCVPVEIRFTPAPGPLTNAAQVYWHLGVNGFQGAADLAMTNSGTGTWVYAYSLPLETTSLDFDFHDGAATNRVWDNNLGEDWHVAVNGCANLPSYASVSPAVPQGCVPVTIVYEERSGLLKNATNVNWFAGQNGWQGVVVVPMAESSPGVWTCQHQIPQDTWQLDFVFNGSVTNSTVWDNHSGADWHTFVVDCVDPQVQGVIITNPSGDVVVGEAVTNLSLAGRAAADVVGQLAWSNSLTGQSGQLPAVTNWSVSSVAVLEGANLIRLSGTNSGVNPNAASRDSATNAVYAAGLTWTNNQNGGTGWGGGWQLSTIGNGGHFLAALPGATNLDIGTHGWALWASDGGLAAAVRPLAARLQVGDVLQVRLDNHWINGGSSVGMGLQNRFGQNLFEFLFVGGGSNYLANDSVGHDLGIPFTDHGLDVKFQLTSGTDYQLTVGTQVFAGVLSPSSEAVIQRLRLWNYSAGGGDAYNFYASDLKIDGVPLAAAAFGDEVTVTRPFGPYSDQDGDGYVRWEEEFAGTEPGNAASHLPDIQPLGTGAVFRVDLASTVAGKYYDLFFATNLLAPQWQRHGQDAQGSGGPLTLGATNAQECSFWRLGVYEP